MTSELLTAAKTKLLRKLGLSESPDAATDDLLTDELESAESALLLYLRWDELSAALLPKAVDLAALYYRRDAAGPASGALKASSYSEDKVSQSETYLDASDYEVAEAAILAGLAKYREVRIR